MQKSVISEEEVFDGGLLHRKVRPQCLFSGGCKFQQHTRANQIFDQDWLPNTL